MVGLLYKDFVAVKGKKMACILGICTAVFTLLRILFPGDAINGRFIITNDVGSTTSIIDLIFCLGIFSILLFGGYMINGFGSRLVRFDDKNKIKNYLCALPIKKKSYVTSKYLLIGIMTVAVYLLYAIWHGLFTAFAAAGHVTGIAKMIWDFSIPFISIIVFIEALELPLFINLGKDKTMLIKIGLIMLAGAFVMAYLLFGDLSEFESFDVYDILLWLSSHSREIDLLKTLSPLISIALYYISYLIAAHFYVKK